MPAPKNGVYKINDTLRLCWDQGRPIGEVARSACCSPLSVVATEHRAQAASLDWSCAQPLDEAARAERVSINAFGSGSGVASVQSNTIVKAPRSSCPTIRRPRSSVRAATNPNRTRATQRQTL
jgi:hypothetical protein